MKAKLLYIVSILTSIFLISCTSQTNNPISFENSPTNGLFKTQANQSTHIALDSSRAFNYDGYRFKLYISKIYYQNAYWNQATITVNDTSIGSVNWKYLNDSSSSVWLGEKTFTYNGVNMLMNIHIPKDTSSATVYPDSVYVTVWDYVKPNAITNLSASPSVHKNLHQAVTLNWTSSTDTAVTGYKIYRELNGQSSYSLVKSITSRATSQWIDSTVTWSTTNTAQYYIKVYDGTHDLLSNISNYVLSYMLTN
jgi:hypothetical protein